MVDEEGKLWVGTDAGLNHLRQKSLFAFAQKAGLGDGAAIVAPHPASATAVTMPATSPATRALALRARELPYNRISALAKTSEEIRSLVARATEPDPAARYETAAEFQSDLRAVLNQITPSTFALRELARAKR